MDQNNQRKPQNQKNVPPTKNQELMARIVLIVVVVAVAALLILGIVLGIKNCGDNNIDGTTTSENGDGTTTTNDGDNEGTTTGKDGTTTSHESPVASDLSSGNLILVNYIDEDNNHEFAFPKVSNVIARPKIANANFALSSNNIKLQKDVWAAFNDMINALNAEEEIFATLGEDKLIIHTAYRAYEDQPSSSSIPAGYSEYHTGLAMNIKVFGADKKTYTLDDSKYADVAAWITENAADYGFILRYLDGKEDVTGVEHEDLPWHLRYVGVPAAKIMEAEAADGNVMCLEEFVEFIKDYSKNDAYKITVDGIEYKMYYVKGTSTPDVEDFYQMSGNNADGFIITLKK